VYLALVPIALPAPVEHQRSEGRQGRTRFPAPLHPVSLLPSRHDQIIGFLDMPAPDILPLDAALAIIRDPCLARLQIGDQGLQWRRIPGLEAR
jgi:hypothetical protein